jgi:hypothetical protein
MKTFDKDPKGIVLGDSSINDLLYYKHHIGKYNLEPEIEGFGPENLLARQSYLSYFRSNFPSNLKFYRDRADFTLYEADEANRRKTYDINLTMSHYACYYEEIKLLLAGPNKLLYIEDLATLELEELQFLFFKTVSEFKVKADNDYFDPNIHPKDFLYCLKLLSREIHTEKLFDKKCLYTAAVYRKLHKVYAKNMLFMPNELVVKTYNHLTDSFCPEYDEIFRDKEYQKKLSEMKVDEEGLEILIEKMVIISFLYDKEFRNYLEGNKNPLKIMLNGKFAQYDLQLVQSLFNQINAFYMRELEALFFDDLKRISKTEANGRVMLKDYNEELAKLEKNNKFYFVTDKYTKIKELNFIESLLRNQIILNIRRRELLGINQNEIKLIIRKYKAGIRTKETIDVYNELLVEANTQLQLLRLDESFRPYEYKVREVLKEGIAKMYGENPDSLYKDSVIKMYNQAKGIDPLIIKDGSEPELNHNDIDYKMQKLNDYTESIIEKRTDIVAKLEDYLESHNKATDEERKKLTVIKDICQAFKSEGEGSAIMLNPQFDISLFEDKSIEELKKMDVEDVAKYTYHVNREGEVEIDTDYESNAIDKLNREADNIMTTKLSSFEDFQPEKKFEVTYQKIFPKLKEESIERVDKITKALEMGQYIDDPVYIELIFTNEKFIKKREEYLKLYYAGKLDKNTLLGKYVGMKGDIVDNMKIDRVFYEYDTPMGKKVSKLYHEVSNEIIQEEEMVNDPTRIDMYNIEDEQDEEILDSRVYSLNYLIADKVKELEEYERAAKYVLKEHKLKEAKMKQSSLDLEMMSDYKPGRKKYK